MPAARFLGSARILEVTMASGSAVMFGPLTRREMHVAKRVDVLKSVVLASASPAPLLLGLHQQMMMTIMVLKQLKQLYLAAFNMDLPRLFAVIWLRHTPAELLAKLGEYPEQLFVRVLRHYFDQLSSSACNERILLRTPLATSGSPAACSDRRLAALGSPVVEGCWAPPLATVEVPVYRVCKPNNDG